MKFKKIAYKLHLWLGLISGLIVFIVCVTGAIWALKINGWIDRDPTYTIERDKNSILKSPSELSTIVTDSLNWSPTYISYEKNGVAYVANYKRGQRAIALLNPITGKILEEKSFNRDKKASFDFWHFIRMCHRALWLPFDIGRPIVNYGTLMFVIILITGLIIWFPKTKKAAKGRLWFNWKKKTPLKRRLFDMHSVLGFYSCFFLLAIAASGMVWGIEWWSKGLYTVTTGGKTLPEWRTTESDTTATRIYNDAYHAVDVLFNKLMLENPKADQIGISLPDSTLSTSVIEATVSPDKNVYYNSDRYTFDRYTLTEIGGTDVYNGRYADLGSGDKLRRMNYEIHIGAVGGQAGRVLVFFAALFGASLPCTGVYMFFKRRVKKK